MPDDRRIWHPGGTCFFTVNLLQRHGNDLLTRHIETLRDSLRRVRKRYPLHIHGWVVLPEHLSTVRALRGERGIWQHRYWEHLIRNEADYRAHRDCVPINPLKHGLATRVADWPFSTFHRLVADGVYSTDWAGGFEAGVRYDD